MITLNNVMDIRTGQVYSVAVVSPKNARYFIPVENEGVQPNEES